MLMKYVRLISITLISFFFDLQSAPQFLDCKKFSTYYRTNNFKNILYCAGHSFLQSDIAVFQQNVQALEQLNTRWKLYSRPVFAETLLAEFLTVFLQVILLISVDLFCSMLHAFACLIILNLRYRDRHDS